MAHRLQPFHLLQWPLAKVERHVLLKQHLLQQPPVRCAEDRQPPLWTRQECVETASHLIHRCKQGTKKLADAGAPKLAHSSSAYAILLYMARTWARLRSRLERVSRHCQPHDSMGEEQVGCLQANTYPYGKGACSRGDGELPAPACADMQAAVATACIYGPIIPAGAHT